MGNNYSNNFGKKAFKGSSKTSGYSFLKIVRSKKAGKKLDAVFLNLKTNKKKVISFGQKNASDFTKHKDVQRKNRYIARHKNRENWNDLMSRGALSRWILWNKPTLKASIADYKKKIKKKKVIT
jgi:hypothetical protein